MTDLFGDVATIKCLSLWQPWGSLVAKGVKRHETRHWSTEYRGPIAIHAAKTVVVEGAPVALCIAALGKNWKFAVPRGEVVAIAELVGCRDAGRIVDQLTRADYEAGNFAPGRFAWVLDKVRPLMRPVPLVGRQGLFNWTPPEDLESRLGPVVDHEAACRYIGSAT